MKDDFDFFELRLGIRYKLNDKIYGTQSTIVRMILKETLNDGAKLLEFVRNQYHDLGFKEGDLTQDKSFKIQVLFHEIEPLIKYSLVLRDNEFSLILNEFNYLNPIEKLEAILPKLDLSLTSIDYENHGTNTQQEYILLYDSCKSKELHQRLIEKNSKYFKLRYKSDYCTIINQYF